MQMGKKAQTDSVSPVFHGAHFNFFLRRRGGGIDAISGNESRLTLCCKMHNSSFEKLSRNTFQSCRAENNHLIMQHAPA